MSENASEAAASIFNSKMNHKPAELRFRYMFSELDIGTKQDVVWDLWIKFPFKVPKNEAEKFKEAVNGLFQTLLCH